MYFCQVLNKMSKPCEKLNKITIKSRNIEYKHWDPEAEENWSSFGTEVVKEVNASDEGLALWSSFSDVEKEAFVKRFA